jgi:ketopantoate reductase
MATSLIKGSIGILPPGALGVSFFYHLTRELQQLDGQVYFLERRGSQSAAALKQSGKINIATPQGIQSLGTENIFQPDLLTCCQSGFLPEVVLVCTNPDQLLGVITTMVELLVMLYERGSMSALQESFPFFVLTANGIYFQRFRQIFIEKIEEAILFARLPDLWPATMPQIVCRLLRGVTIQTGLRQGDGKNTVYKPGLRGRTQITGTDAGVRADCTKILADRGAWFEEAVYGSATRVEFDKALVNLVTNFLGQLLAIDNQGNFRALTVGEILDPSHQPRMRELIHQVFRVGQMMKVYDLQEDVEVIFQQVLQTCHPNAEHIPSSLQWVQMKLSLGALEVEMTPTEAWLLEPLIRYAKVAGLEDTASYFQQLKDELLGKLALAREAGREQGAGSREKGV